MANPFVVCSTYRENQLAREKRREKGLSTAYQANRERYLEKAGRSR